MVKLSRLHHSGPDLRRVCAWKRTNYDSARLQQPSRPCRSNRSRDASVASRRSSSGQQSDHSTARPPPRSASRCAQTSTFVASPGGSIRTTLMRNSSLELRTMVPFLVPVYRHRHLDKGSRPQGALSTPADCNAASSATLVEALFGRFGRPRRSTITIGPDTYFQTPQQSATQSTRRARTAMLRSNRNGKRNSLALDLQKPNPRGLTRKSPEFN